VNVKHNKVSGSPLFIQNNDKSSTETWSLKALASFYSFTISSDPMASRDWKELILPPSQGGCKENKQLAWLGDNTDC